MTIATSPLPLILRTQSAIAWGWGGELWRLHASGRAQSATRRGWPRSAGDDDAPQGRKVSAVQGLAPDGSRPAMMSCRNVVWLGSSHAIDDVTDSRTCLWVSRPSYKLDGVIDIETCTCRAYFQ